VMVVVAALLAAGMGRPARALTTEEAVAAMDARPLVPIERNLEYLRWKADEQEFNRKNLTWTSIGREVPGTRPPSRFVFFTGGFLGGFLSMLAFEAVVSGKRVTSSNFGTAMAMGGAMGLVAVAFSYRLAPFNPRTSLDAPPDAPLDQSPVVRDWSRLARESVVPPASPGY